jgi:hypothetical protein
LRPEDQATLRKYAMTGIEPVITSVLSGVAGGSMGEAGAHLWDEFTALVQRGLGRKFASAQLPEDPAEFDADGIGSLAALLAREAEGNQEFGQELSLWLDAAVKIDAHSDVSNTILGNPSGPVVQARDIENVRFS